MVARKKFVVTREKLLHWHGKGPANTMETRETAGVKDQVDTVEGTEYSAHSNLNLRHH